ncbi:MAG: hypothetical protein ACLTDR_06070 [Adlercreutzia equolifaciens]
MPTYDHGNQLLEDEDNNVFFLDRDRANDDYPDGPAASGGIPRRQRGVRRRRQGVPGPAPAAPYDYDALYKAGVRELKDSGYWVENTNLNGGRQYKDGEDVEVPETPVEPENPNPTDPENPGETTDPENPEPRRAGYRRGSRRRLREDAGTRIVAEPAMRSFSLARMALAAAEEVTRGLRRRREHRGDRPG